MSNLTNVETSNKGVVNIDWDYIKDSMFPVGSSISDMNNCLKITQSMGLNPLLGEVFFIERKAKQQDGTMLKKIDPMVSRDGFLTIAHKTRLFNGIETY